MSSQHELCQICAKDNYKYVCPKCNILFCSVVCYRAVAHMRCSEEFYKQWIKDEEKLKPDRKVKENLPEFIAENEELDSDDDSEEEEDLAERMLNVNLDDWNEVWNKLTVKERELFWEGCESGQIVGSLPPFKPWWEDDNVKIVDVSEQAEAEKNESNMPEIIKISFSKKTYSPQLPFNLVNIIGAYALTYRLYRGDFAVNYYESAAMLINLCCVLKENATFENSDEALNSITIEATTLTKTAFCVTDYLENLQLVTDTTLLTNNQTFQMAALSHVLRVVEAAKAAYSRSNENHKANLKAHCMSVQLKPLDAKELRKIVKKIEFFLGYVTLLKS